MGMIQMDMDGFLRNCTSDYVKFREKLDGLLADADDEEREEFLSEADQIHDNLVFLVDTIKLPSNDPDANKVLGVKLGIEAAAQFTLTHISTPLGGTMKHGTKADDGAVDMAYAIRALDAAVIVKKGM